MHPFFLCDHLCDRYYTDTCLRELFLQQSGKCNSLFPIPMQTDRVGLDRDLCPVYACHNTFLYHPYRPPDGSFFLFDHSPFLRARDKCSVRLIGSVRKYFICNFQSGLFSCFYQLTARQSKQDQSRCPPHKCLPRSHMPASHL